MERTVDKEKEREEWLRIHDESVREIRSALSRYEYNIQEHLADIVASFCGVDTEVIFSKKRLDIDKIQATGLSNTQQYKMAGNSIVVNVLEAIFKNLFMEG